MDPTLPMSMLNWPRSYRVGIIHESSGAGTDAVSVMPWPVRSLRRGRPPKQQVNWLSAAPLGSPRRVGNAQGGLLTSDATGFAWQPAREQGLGPAICARNLPFFHIITAGNRRQGRRSGFHAWMRVMVQPRDGNGGDLAGHGLKRGPAGDVQPSVTLPLFSLPVVRVLCSLAMSSALVKRKKVRTQQNQVYVTDWQGAWLA